MLAEIWGFLNSVNPIVYVLPILPFAFVIYILIKSNYFKKIKALLRAVDAGKFESNAQFQKVLFKMSFSYIKTITMFYIGFIFWITFYSALFFYIYSVAGFENTVILLLVYLMVRVTFVGKNIRETIAESLKYKKEPNLKDINGNINQRTKQRQGYPEKRSQLAESKKVFPETN